MGKYDYLKKDDKKRSRMRLTYDQKKFILALVILFVIITIQLVIYLKSKY